MVYYSDEHDYCTAAAASTMLLLLCVLHLPLSPKGCVFMYTDVVHTD